MVIGAATVFFTGFPHVWSIYQPYITDRTGWSAMETAMCFYFALVAFVAGNVAGGKMQEIYSPVKVLWAGGTVFSTGILASAFFITDSPIPMYLTYGIMQGVGQGMLYTVIVSGVQKWFPERTGFASGIVVTANGLCGFFMAPVSRILLETVGLEKTFLLIGAAVTVVCVICGMTFRVPEPGFYRNAASCRQTGEEGNTGGVQNEYSASFMIRTGKFYLLLSTMLFSLLPYFLLSPVSQAVQVSAGVSPEGAVKAVMAGSVVNACARLILPSLADRVGRVYCLSGVFVFCFMAMLLLVRGEKVAVAAAVVITYGCYGGIMGSFPSFTTSIFGIRHAGENYGYVMLGVVAAAFGAPVITSYMNAIHMQMKSVFALGAVFAFISFVCLILLSRQIGSGRQKRRMAEEVRQSVQ